MISIHEQRVAVDLMVTCARSIPLLFFNIYLLSLIMFSSKFFDYVKCKIYSTMCYNATNAIKALNYQDDEHEQYFAYSSPKEEKKRKKREDMKRSTEPFLLKINNNRV